MVKLVSVIVDVSAESVLGLVVIGLSREPLKRGVSGASESGVNVVFDDDALHTPAGPPFIEYDVTFGVTGIHCLRWRACMPLCHCSTRRSSGLGVCRRGCGQVGERIVVPVWNGQDDTTMCTQFLLL
jgi:hypothetical protein